MAENKSDFIIDPKVLSDEATVMVEKLRQGFNLSSANQPNIDIVTKKYFGGLERPVIRFRNQVGDFSKMLSADGWKYGVYYLQGSPKTGFYKMKDGQYMFIETEQEYNSLATQTITNVQEMKLALFAKNPQLNDENVQAVDGKITIGIPYLDHLEMPSSEWVYDAAEGKIHSTAREYSFDIEVTNANSMNEGYKTEEGTSKTIEARKSSEADNERLENRVSEDGTVVSDDAVNIAAKNNLKIDLADFSPQYMFETFQRCYGVMQKDGDEFECYVKSPSQNGAYRSIDARKQENSSGAIQQVKEWAFVNMLWIDACKLSYNEAAAAFTDRGYSSVLVAIMRPLTSGVRSADEILKNVAGVECNDSINIAYAFLSSLTNLAGFQIDFTNVNINNLEQYKENEHNQGMAPPTMKGPGAIGV